MNIPRRLVTALGLTVALAASGSLARADDGKGVVFLEGTPAFSEVLAKASADGKPVFIDFQTSWCGWCRRLEKDVYTQASVADAMKAFVNVNYDAEKGEGKGLAEKFHVHAFPTLVITDAGGAEIDRIEGYRPPEAFTKEIERIRKGEDTIPALKQKAAAAPDDAAANMALARKLTVADPAQAEAILDRVIEKAKGKDRALEAEAWISLSRAARNAEHKDRAKAACDRVLADFADSEYAAEALQAAIPPRDPEAALAFLGKIRKDSKNARLSAFADAVVAEIHLRAAAAALRRRAEVVGDDPQALNELAWTAFEHKMNLKAALGWAQKAVQLSKRDPAILDTLANLQFATGKIDDALKTEQEALDGAKSEPMKAEFGETLAKWKAAAAFRSSHPLAMAQADEAEDDEDDEGALEERVESRTGPAGGAKPPAPDSK